MTVHVLVVDDSASMRHLIRHYLSRDPELKVVGEAANPHEARAAIKQLSPDVMTLDVEMPEMNGIDFLEKVMRLRPMPVVMVSSLTQKGASASMAALEIGAFECVAKPASGSTEGFSQLAEIVKAAAAAGPAIRRRYGGGVANVAENAPYTSDGRVLAIGSSTGGVEALVEILSAFPENCPPTLIVQHMPELFTARFAKRLDNLCPAHVMEAYDDAPVKEGCIYVAPGGRQHLQIAGGERRVCRMVEGDLVTGHRPSVDMLFRSVATLGPRAVGVILTGMGRDGAAGLLAMRQAGASTLGQDESSCIVYGMPRAAFEMGSVERQVSASRMAAEILSMTNCLRKAR